MTIWAESKPSSFAYSRLSQVDQHTIFWCHQEVCYCAPCHCHNKQIQNIHIVIWQLCFQLLLLDCPLVCASISTSLCAMSSLAWFYFCHGLYSFCTLHWASANMTSIQNPCCNLHHITQLWCNEFNCELNAKQIQGWRMKKERGRNINKGNRKRRPLSQRVLIVFQSGELFLHFLKAMI